ncbi:HAMP domain-containing protein [Paenibacillus albiflavus]|uniref:Heme sensor protein HssS n=1 Tax=Paenibacillus albiflavus TaxID=2545760 RepID=A0A4R4EB99_9BACL|nr:HAMP domain-containing sensor histidine kinase [Paenibacillus albiflavus]TCZ76587.1 HAMP domain-containing protein [Paenibacillus albiflavus]
MKTLYVRIVLIALLIGIISSILGLLATNIHYQMNLKTYYEEKLVHIAKEIRTLYSKSPELSMDDYFPHMANTGFQIFLTDGTHSHFYGRAFGNTELAPERVQKVLNGEVYYGAISNNSRITIAGYFENSLHNSVGIPIQISGKPYALFIKPDLTQQIGEVRNIMALLLTFTALFSIVLIIIFTRYIVKPIRSLTTATQKIVNGEYEFRLDVNRKDEIGELARHFAHMSESLKQLDEMRQEFVANVSHEIQSPLTSIQGFVHEILNEETNPNDKERYLHIIDEESRRLSSLSKQLLTLASLDKESGVIKPSLYRLDEQIRQIVIANEWLWADKEIMIELDLAEIKVRADQQLLHLVWTNLLVNAIKFSEHGSSIQINIRIEQQIIVTIQDHGIGIPEEELPHIFDRFYKVDKARNRSRSGSGLGLSIVQQIIRLHRGTIDVQSQIGIGTTFIIQLPHL